VTDPAASAFSPPDPFDAHALLQCYAHGVFPMGEDRADPRVYLVEPEHRGVIPLEGFHVPARLRRTIRNEPFVVRVDTAFDAVLHACAASAPGREETWINDPIMGLYLDLHLRGFAHSIECWRDEVLVGGLYGVTLGGAFFGESMFSRATDASKVALVHLVARLRLGGWRLLDAQFRTPHLDQFGLLEIPQRAYLTRLADALPVMPDQTALTRPFSGAEAVTYALQPTTQAS
jgi:leucyl/phenylalanyl-tRNA--protein transferase